MMDATCFICRAPVHEDEGAEVTPAGELYAKLLAYYQHHAATAAKESGR